MDKGPEGIHLHRRELKVMDQNQGRDFGVLGCCPQSAPNSLILVAGDLLCCGKAATSPARIEKSPRNLTPRNSWNWLRTFSRWRLSQPTKGD